MRDDTITHDREHDHERHCCGLLPCFREPDADADEALHTTSPRVESPLPTTLVVDTRSAKEREQGLHATKATRFSALVTHAHAHALPLRPMQPKAPTWDDVQMDDSARTLLQRHDISAWVGRRLADELGVHSVCALQYVTDGMLADLKLRPVEDAMVKEMLGEMRQQAQQQAHEGVAPQQAEDRMQQQAKDVFCHPRLQAQAAARAQGSDEQL